MKNSTRAIPAIFVVLWATGYIGTEYAMRWSEPFTFLAARFLIAFLILACALPMMKRQSLRPKAAVHAMIAGALMHGVHLGGVFWAIGHGLPVGLTALVIGLLPVVTAVMAGAFLGEAITGRHWMGLAAGFAGLAMVLSPKLGATSDGVTLPSFLAALVAVLSISAGAIWQKRFVSGMGLLSATMFQYLGASLVMIAASLAWETRRFEVNAELVLAMTWLVLVLSIGAVFLLMYMIREGEVARVASLFYLVPAVTALMAWALFGEMLTSLQIGGVLVTSIGVALAGAQPETRSRASL